MLVLAFILLFSLRLRPISQNYNKLYKTISNCLTKLSSRSINFCLLNFDLFTSYTKTELSPCFT